MGAKNVVRYANQGFRQNLTHMYTLRQNLESTLICLWDSGPWWLVGLPPNAAAETQNDREATHTASNRPFTWNIC